MTFVDVEAGTQCEVQALGQALQQAGDADLVDHLRQLAGPNWPDQRNRLRIGLQDRPRALEHPGITADHDGQLAVLGACLAAGQRRIEEPDLPLSGGGVQVARQRRGRRGVINEDRSGRHRLQNAVVAERYLPHVVVVADATEHDIGTIGRIGRRGRAAAGVLLEPAIGLVRTAVEDDDVVTAHRKVAGHRVPHDAEPYERRLHEPALRGSRPIERATISRMISEDPA